MKKEDNAVAGFLALSMILIFIFSVVSIKEPKAAVEPISGCDDGQRVSCKTPEGCGGQMLCRGGRFTECVGDEYACNPGESKMCKTRACGFGQTRCDECGQWSECIYR